jgi:alpha-beta hydrolase superfamily lysophospholipase
MRTHTQCRRPIHVWCYLIVFVAVTFLAATTSLSIQKSRTPSQETYMRADGHRVEARVLQAGGAGCAPLAIVSHGLGGNADSNAQLANTLQKSGYRVIVPTHAESGPRLLIKGIRSSAGNARAGIEDAAASIDAYKARVADLDAILATEEARCSVPYKLLAGHSMGARTVLIEAGALSSTRIAGRDRFDIYVAVSPEGEGNDFFPKGAMRPIRKPTVVITGTKDDSVDGNYQTRLSTYDGLSSDKKRLAIIEGASHLDLGGRSQKIGDMVGVLASEFASQIRPGPSASAERHAGVTIIDGERKVGR